MQDDVHSYCLYCTTGKEQNVAAQITGETGFTAFAPTLVQVEWKGRMAARREQIMFPGYVFFYASCADTLPQVSKITHVRKLLTYGGGQQFLYGHDEDIAQWLFQYGGVIRESKALREGDHIVVVDGPMKDFGGVIRSVNKQRQRANIEFTFGGLTRNVWMAFDWVSSAEEAPPARIG